MGINKISAVIITYNEEKNIERCLLSLQDVADEIVVVDSFSNDKTPQICEKFSQVRFYRQKWLGYSKQKNYANSLATYDFILSIDADELLSAELIKSIRKIKTDNIDNTVFSMNRLTNYCGSWIRHSGWYPDTKIRLFQKFIRWEGDIHEKLALPSNVKIKKLKGDLYHYTIYNVSEHLKQVDKFTTIAANELFKKGKRSHLIDVFIRPKWKFFRDYFINLGILDGFAGYNVCKISAFATFLKYSKLKELRKENE